MVPGLKHTAYLVTKTPVSLFDGTATATFSLGTWPTGRTGKLKITVSSVSGHTDCAGTITAGSETITFTQAGTKTSTVNLTAKPVTTSANLDCHVHITVIDSGGADIVAETLTAIKCRWDDTQKSYRSPDGTFTMSAAQVLTASASCNIGACLRYNSNDYIVQQVQPYSKLSGREFLRRLYM